MRKLQRETKNEEACGKRAWLCECVVAVVPKEASKLARRREPKGSCNSLWLRSKDICNDSKTHLLLVRMSQPMKATHVSDSMH